MTDKLRAPSAKEMAKLQSYMDNVAGFEGLTMDSETQVALAEHLGGLYGAPDNWHLGIAAFACAGPGLFEALKKTRPGVTVTVKNQEATLEKVRKRVRASREKQLIDSTDAIHAIVQGLRKLDTVHVDRDTDEYRCVLCDARTDSHVSLPEEHSSDCPWRLARELP